MTPVLLIVAALAAEGPRTPQAVIVATARGERTISVAMHRGYPALPTAPLAQWLPLTATLRAGWAEVTFGGRPFRFLLDAPVAIEAGAVVPLAGGAYQVSDTLFVPLQFLAEMIPARFSEGYRWDPLAARFEERGLTPVVRVPVAQPAPPARTSAPPVAQPARRAPNRWGLRQDHHVMLDPGHGGTDGGNPGRFFPVGVTEKHVTLAIARRAAGILRERGLRVSLTRTTDTLIGLFDRAPMCRADCSLFVSIHVDALAPRRGYEAANGPHTYFLGEALTADAARVAALENEALRYETGTIIPDDDPLWFIIRDLQTNEFLRESALLANLVQSKAAAVHPGRNRGVQQARLAVLRTATRPAILVETGFATNRADARYLASTEGQQQLALAIADGVIEYLRRYEDKTDVGIAR
ncbi:MAG: N-acetylmuramoyl-L-alanine amidase [Gemmatimonadales bacterium]